MIGFRALEERDLELLHRWLNEPGVVAWWEGEDVSREAVTRDDIDSDDRTEHWICQVDGVDVGWIQCYAATVFPEESEPWFEIGVDRSAAGIDYLIGEASMRGSGLGASMIHSFVHDVVFARHLDWTQACAAPFAANEGSWRALQKAGFRRVGVTQEDAGPCNVMVLDRPPAR